MARCAISDTTSTTLNNPAKASSAKPRGFSPDSSRLENIGTKAVLKAPSAKKRRNMLGRVKATI